MSTTRTPKITRRKFEVNDGLTLAGDIKNFLESDVTSQELSINGYFSGKARRDEREIDVSGFITEARRETYDPVSTKGNAVVDALYAKGVIFQDSHGEDTFDVSIEVLTLKNGKIVASLHI